MLLKSLLGSILFLYYSCASDSLYTHTVRCANNTWKRSEICAFNISLDDIDHTYDVYLLLAYTNDFPYQNLYISHQVEGEEKNILATALSNHILYNVKTGTPLGKSWGNTKFIRLPLIYGCIFPQSGHYRIELTHFMRLEELQGIERVGLQVCKSKAIKA